MPTRSQVRKVIAAAVVPVSVIGASALVFGGSYAAFSATTAADTTFTAGAVNLTNTASAGFVVNTIVPSATPTYRCIVVKYTGTVAATGKVYVPAATYAATNNTGAGGTNLEDQLALTIDQQPGNLADANGACTSSASWAPKFSGTPVALKTGHGDWANGFDFPAQLAPGAEVTYRIGYNLPDAGVGGNNDQMNDAVNFDLTWEARSV